MLYSEVIRKKRDGDVLSPDEIKGFVAGITDGTATDAHISALAMAVYFKGLNEAETVALTMAMRDSGSTLDWSELDRPVVDKHSTGGVGDNVSLMLAPIAAACGVAVPMISGRGLGHTGGTLDKMDSIPGYISQPDNDLFRKVTREVGCAIIGQTADLAPADKRFYGVRDVTATVENLSLITASILSKKLAAGLGSLVLDVKFGNGAFMDSFEKAEELAQSLVKVANGAGTNTSAILTDMNEPLASAAGNAVEVQNAVAFLRGDHRDARLEEVTLALVSDMLVLAGTHSDAESAHAACEKALYSGAAADLFGQMVHALGGPSDFMDQSEKCLPAAPIIRPIEAPLDGHLSAIDTRAIGIAVVEIGGGRRRREDVVDHAVGLTQIATKGVALSKGDVLAMAHVRDEEQYERTADAVRAAVTISSGVSDQPAPVVAKRLTG